MKLILLSCFCCTVSFFIYGQNPIQGKDSQAVFTLSFMLMNASASVHIWKWFSFEPGINNIFDRNYSLVEGYPEAGRNYFVNISYRL